MQRRMIERIWEEDEAGDKKVAIPPVDSGRPPPADRMAIRLDAQEPARRKHLQKHAESTHHAQPKLDSMTDRHQGLARSRPYWPLSARGSCCRSPQRICGDRPRAGGRRGRRARGMPKGTSCHALLPPRLLTDLQRAVYVSGMVRDDAGIERAEGKVHLSHVGVDHPDGLEKTPATTPLDPSVSAPWPASSRTQTTSRRGGRTDSRSAPQPD
jgi:hypothetical protein